MLLKVVSNRVWFKIIGKQHLNAGEASGLGLTKTLQELKLLKHHGQVGVELRHAAGDCLVLSSIISAESGTRLNNELRIITQER